VLLARKSVTRILVSISTGTLCPVENVLGHPLLPSALTQCFQSAIEKLSSSAAGAVVTFLARLQIVCLLTYLLITADDTQLANYADATTTTDLQYDSLGRVAILGHCR